MIKGPFDLVTIDPTRERPIAGPIGKFRKFGAAPLLNSVIQVDEDAADTLEKIMNQEKRREEMIDERFSEEPSKDINHATSTTRFEQIE